MRIPARLLLTGVAAFALASCYAERPLAPAGAPTVGGNPALRALVVAQTFDLVIPVTGGKVNVADVYQLDFPAGAVCDPTASDTQEGYASESWDAPCTAATSDVAIRATVKYSMGNLYVDFQPALRFVPSKTVTLSTGVFASGVEYYDQAGQKVGALIRYSPGIEQTPVADALLDASLKTKVNGSTGTISRRIKHFSGYMVWGSDGWVPCDPAAGNPECVWVDDGIH